MQREIEKKAIIYLRVSTTEQVEFGSSLATQEATCLEYAKRQDITVLRLFIEKGESAKTTDRTELKKLLDFIQTRHTDIDYLIVFKLDRLARNLVDYTNLVSILSKYGIILKSATETIGETPEGKLMQNVIASFAQFDNDQKSQRTTIGMKHMLEQGGWVNLAPYGYKNERINNIPSLVFTTDKKIVEKIFNDFLSGKKQYEIVNDFKNIGIKISFQKVSTILANPVYAGIVNSILLDKPVKGMHKPIINEIEFFKIQELLNKNTSKLYKPILAKDFPLTRFLKCPYCKTNLKGSWSQGRRKKYPYYHCTKKGCAFKPIRKEIAESIFADYLKSIEPTDKILNDFISSIKEINISSQQETKKRTRLLKNELKELNLKKDRIEELAINGTFTKDRFQKKIKEVEQQLISKEIAIENLQKQTIDIDGVLNYAQNFLKNISNLWLKAEIELKRGLQDFIFPQGIFIENNQGRTAKMSTIFDYLSTSFEVHSKVVPEAGIEPARG